MKRCYVLFMAGLFSSASLSCGLSTPHPQDFVRQRFISKTGAFIPAPYPPWWSDFIKGIREADQNMRVEFPLTEPQVALVRPFGDPSSSRHDVENFFALANLLRSRDANLSADLIPLRISTPGSHDERGYFERDGSLRFRMQCTLAGYFSDGLAAVRVGEVGHSWKWGYIDENGVWVIPSQYDAATDFSEGLAPVMTGGTWRDIRETEASTEYRFSAIMEDAMWGYVDREGQFVIEPRFSDAGRFVNGLAPVSTSSDMDGVGRVGFINREGEFVLESNSWVITGEFSEGLAPVDVGGFLPKYGYIDAKGTMQIPPRFAEAKPFSDGLAAVRVGRKWGYIDKKGQFVIEPQFKEAWPFTSGVAVVIIH